MDASVFDYDDKVERPDKRFRDLAEAEKRLNGTALFLDKAADNPNDPLLKEALKATLYYCQVSEKQATKLYDIALALDEPTLTTAIIRHIDESAENSPVFEAHIAAHYADHNQPLSETAQRYIDERLVDIDISSATFNRIITRPLADQTNVSGHALVIRRLADAFVNPKCRPGKQEFAILCDELLKASRDMNNPLNRMQIADLSHSIKQLFRYANDELSPKTTVFTPDIKETLMSCEAGVETIITDACDFGGMRLTHDEFISQLDNILAIDESEWVSALPPRMKALASYYDAAEKRSNEALSLSSDEWFLLLTQISAKMQHSDHGMMTQLMLNAPEFITPEQHRDYIHTLVNRPFTPKNCILLNHAIMHGIAREAISPAAGAEITSAYLTAHADKLLALDKDNATSHAFFLGTSPHHDIFSSVLTDEMTHFNSQGATLLSHVIEHGTQAQFDTLLSAMPSAVLNNESLRTRDGSGSGLSRLINFIERNPEDFVAKQLPHLINPANHFQPLEGGNAFYRHCTRDIAQTLADVSPDALDDYARCFINWADNCVRNLSSERQRYLDIGSVSGAMLDTGALSSDVKNDLVELVLTRYHDIAPSLANTNMTHVIKHMEKPQFDDVLIHAEQNRAIGKVADNVIAIARQTPIVHDMVMADPSFYADLDYPNLNANSIATINEALCDCADDINQHFLDGARVANDPVPAYENQRNCGPSR